MGRECRIVGNCQCISTIVHVSGSVLGRTNPMWRTPECGGGRQQAYARSTRRARQSLYYDLNLCTSIPRALIFDASVCRGRPSLAAAPAGPDTRPRHSANAASMRARSCAAWAATRGTAGPAGWGVSPLSQRSSTAKVSPAHRMTARSIRCPTPGHRRTGSARTRRRAGRAPRADADTRPTTGPRRCPRRLLARRDRRR